MVQAVLQICEVSSCGIGQRHSHFRRGAQADPNGANDAEDFQIPHLQYIDRVIVGRVVQIGQVPNVPRCSEDSADAAGPAQRQAGCRHCEHGVTSSESPSATENSRDVSDSGSVHRQSGKQTAPNVPLA